MSKTIITIIVIIIVAGLGYWVYQSTITPEELTEKEQSCIDSGGTVSTSLCCEATDDFPNLCLIGPCGCSPENSHEVKICDCGPDKCFDGNKCISSDEVLAVLESLEQETGIDFSEAQPVDFEWVVKVDPKVEEEAVSGKGFEAEHISSEQYDSIELFLKDNGFEVDLYNIAAGTISELTGYIKGKTVCTVAGGLTGYKEAEGQWVPTDTDNWDITIKCGKVEKTKIEYATEDWQVYTNEKYGYSLKYPTDCLYGPLPGYCKQSPPEERPRECLCYFNAENPDEISLGTYTGTKSDLTGASFVVFHSIYVDSYSPPAGTDLVDWLKENFSQQDIPDEINAEIGGIPAVKVYTPQSPQAYSQENVYFIMNDKLFNIYMIDVDNEDNRALYDKILFTFSLEDKTEEACINSGGEVKTSLCCKSTSDYPNLCLVGPCGCSPENSHEVKICDCGEGKCFDGNTCVLEIDSFNDCLDAGYSILPPTHPDDPRVCSTPDGKNFLEEIEVKVCAEDGDTFSTVVEGHLDSCCEGLKEWFPIPDTRFSIADVCYEVGSPSESNIGLCIKCGDGVCENHPQYDENPCNCPEDCAGKNKSHFSSTEEFCQSNDWKISLSKACEETIKDFPICKLCTP